MTEPKASLLLPTRGENLIGSRAGVVYRGTSCPPPRTTAPHPPYADSAALEDWLVTARSHPEALARAVHVEPSTVTNWTQGRKRPDGRLLVKNSGNLQRLDRRGLGALDALDAISLGGWSWETVLSAANHLLQPGERAEQFRAWWETASPSQRHRASSASASDPCDTSRGEELITALTTLRAYRTARWQAVILYGMAGIGKTTIVRTLIDDERIARPSGMASPGWTVTGI